MSIEAATTVTCPSCSEEFEAKYWKSLNAQIDPDAKEELFSGKLFFAVCPKCKTGHPFTYPVLYHDMDHKVMIQLSLSVEDNNMYIENFKTSESEMMKEFPSIASRAEGYQKRIVNSVNHLREKALIFDCGLDDRVNELVKVFYRAQITKSNPDIAVSDMLFYPGTPNKFVILSENDERQPTMDFDMGIYDKVADTFKSKIEEHSAGCFFINFEWAISVISDERNE